MRRALIVLALIALAAPATPSWAADAPPKFDAQARLAEANSRIAQSQALAQELSRELDLARFAASAAMKEIEALGEIMRRDAEIEAAKAAKAKPPEPLPESPDAKEPK